MKLIIAEKPSLARNIVSALDDNIKRMEGYYIGNNYIITYAFGHLFKLYDIEMYDENYDPSKKYNWTYDNLPFFPEEFRFSLVRDEGIIKQFKIIRSLINDSRVDEIINAGDSDREGEIIIRLIIKYALKGDKRITRLWMPDQTSKTILKELSSLKEDSYYDGLANEGYARTYVDWLYGINMSRFASLKSSSLLRVGRVIAPLVKAIYDRELEIINFVPRDYFVLKSSEKTNDEVVELVSKKEFDIDDKEKLLECITNYNQDEAIVTNVVSEKKVVGAGKLFSLSKLQGELGKRYKMSMDESLQVVQSLYEKGYVSYPRTPSQYLAENEKDKFKEIIANFKKLNINIKFKDSKQIFDDSKIESHSAITPTYKIPKKTDLNEKEQKVYEIIAHRFFAVFASEDCVMLKNSIEIELKNNKEVFKINGDSVLTKGWMVFESKEKKDKLLPNLKVGDKVNINFKELKKTTTPPNRYSTESLNNFLKNPFKDNLKALKEEEAESEELKALFEGIELGTEATRSSIIQNAINSKYISLKDNTYHLEYLGKYYVETLMQLNLMINKEKSANIGKVLKKVYRQEMSISQCLKEVEKEIEDLLANVSNVEVSRPNRIFEVEEKKRLCKCPKCSNFIAITDYGYRCSNSGCSYTLTKDNKLFASLNKKITNKIAKELFTKGQIYFDDLVSKKSGKTYSAFLVCDHSNKYMSFNFKFDNEINKENDVK